RRDLVRHAPARARALAQLVVGPDPSHVVTSRAAARPVRPPRRSRPARRPGRRRTPRSGVPSRASQGPRGRRRCRLHRTRRRPARPPCSPRSRRTACGRCGWSARRPSVPRWGPLDLPLRWLPCPNVVRYGRGGGGATAGWLRRTRTPCGVAMPPRKFARDSCGQDRSSRARRGYANMSNNVRRGAGMSGISPAAEEIVKELRGLGDPEVAEFLGRFFETGPGEYGEGDRFLGIRVPVLRKLARKHQALGLSDCRALLVSPYHEARLLALLILVRAYDRGDEERRAAIYRLYLDHLAYVNNWDLVDCSAEHIVGRHLEAGDKAILYDLARSSSVWERRIAIMATFRYVKAGSFEETLRIADMLLQDPHD